MSNSISQGEGSPPVGMNNNQRPDVTDEEIGMRQFQIRKARAIERAMERIRQGLKSEWAKFTPEEVDHLGWILGEVWAYVAHHDWDELHFSMLSVTDARRILNFSRELANHKRNSVDILQDVYTLVAAKG
jgi:hypothetical protein